MAGRIDVLPIEELYERPKMTPAVIKNIMLKDDFTRINERYCTKVCGLPCGDKEYDKVHLENREVDVLIVLPYKAKSEKWKKGFMVDRTIISIADFIAKDKFKGLSYGFAYAMKCRPESLDKVSISTARKCVPYLVSEIKRAKPRIVLGLGVDVGKILGLPKVPRGIPRHIDIFGASFDLICTLHPKILTMIRQNASGDFWGPDYLDVLRYDFDKVSKVARGEVTLRQLEEVIEEVRKNRIIIATSIQQIKEFRDFLFEKSAGGNNLVISWDTETTSLDPWAPHAKILCNQFGFRDVDGVIKSMVIPLDHRRNDAYNPKAAWELVRDILEEESIVKVTHNGMFDLLYTRVVTGIEVKNVSFDTMLLLHSINSGMQGYYDLKTATSDHLFELQLAEYEKGMEFEDELEEEAGEENEESQTV